MRTWFLVAALAVAGCGDDEKPEPYCELLPGGTFFATCGDRYLATCSEAGPLMIPGPLFTRCSEDGELSCEPGRGEPVCIDPPESD